MKNSISITLKAGAEWVGGFFDHSFAGTMSSRREPCHGVILTLLEVFTRNNRRVTWPRPRIFVGKCDAIALVTAHRRGPLFGAFAEFVWR